jgi:phenylalanine ammonia-lyase
MLLRANVLSQGCSGVRFEIVERLLKFMSADATPVVRELGSIGASGDLVPLSVIGRAITGVSDFVKVRVGDRLVSGGEVLSELQLEPMALRPKEGLAIVNGTSFSAAIAANASSETRQLMALTMAVQAMMLQALQVQEDPFDDFVHQRKPHPGQVWSARMMKRLLTEGRTHRNGKPVHVQDRYSLRCFPQYMGSIVEGIARVLSVVETEMNAVSDNPLIDVQEGRFCQSGNFLGQYLAVAMDDLRRFIGLMAKHLDVQIATLVAPEFNNGLPASLRGNDEVPYNMGLKGLQITGNSIMPMLTWSGNPITEHFPTHAEQFNQNINGLSWGSANLAWKSVGLFRHYLSVATIFAVQALDLRAKSLLNHYDGRALIGTHLVAVYEAACRSMQTDADAAQPLLFNDSDVWLEQHLARINDNLEQHGHLLKAVEPILKSFDEDLPS